MLVLPASEGWLAVVPHLFHRTGDPQLGYEDIKAVYPHMQALTADEVLADVDTALDHLAGAGIAKSRTGVVGFCLGGTVTLVTAVHRDVGAAVTFYGGGLTAGRFGFAQPAGPVVGRLRRPRCRDPGRRRRGAAHRRRHERAADRDRPLRRRRARLPLRRAGELPRTVGDGRVAPHAGLVRPLPHVSGGRR